MKCNHGFVIKNVVLILIVGTIGSRGYAQKLIIDVNPFVGMTFSNLNFSIAGNLDGNNPNILSELNWKGIKGIQIGNEFNLKYNNNYTLDISYSRSFINNGRASDRDYASDNRQNMYSDLTLSSHKGYLQSENISFGYIVLDTYHFFGAVGGLYKRLEQKYYLLNFRNSNEAEFPDLNSYYQTTWNNYGIYLMGRYRIRQKIDLEFKFGIQYVNYNAKANWNLIEDFTRPTSFVHKANGYSYALDVVNKYELSGRLSLKIAYFLFIGNTGNGIDELFLKDQTSTKTKLNEVRTVVAVPTLGLSLKLRNSN